MGSQTNGKPAALDYFTVGRDVFDHPAWYGLTLAHIGLWTVLYAEACRTRGRVSSATVQKMTGWADRDAVFRLLADLLNHDLLRPVDDPLEWYIVAGWDKYQVDYRMSPREREMAARRQREHRARLRDSHVTERDTVTERERERERKNGRRRNSVRGFTPKPPQRDDGSKEPTKDEARRAMSRLGDLLPKRPAEPLPGQPTAVVE